MAPSQDRISHLPESLMLMIVSLLPLKEAIKTSILAKSWRTLWYSRSNVEINEHHFFSDYDYVSMEQMNQNKVEELEDLKQVSCIKFGHSWLSNPLISPSISSFKLIFSNPEAFQIDMERFIALALSHETKSLELDFSLLHWHNIYPRGNLEDYSESFDLPSFVYDYGSLESLKLVSCRFRDDMLHRLGHNLRSVSLGWIEIPNESMLMNLVKNCPSLESLSLEKCFGSTIFIIISYTLKSLVVDTCIDLLHLTVKAPNLTCFKYCGTLVEFGMMSNFPHMKLVDIDFRFMGMFDEESGDKIASLLSKFYFARSLSVCGFVTQVLPSANDEELDQLGRPRIKELTIKTAFHKLEFYGIYTLLDNYPLLEKLRFVFGQRPILTDEMFLLDEPSDAYWANVIPSTNSCVVKKLKVVEIEGFQGNYIQLSILTFFLKYGRALKTILLTE